MTKPSFLSATVCRASHPIDHHLSSSVRCGSTDKEDLQVKAIAALTRLSPEAVLVWKEIATEADAARGAVERRRTEPELDAKAAEDEAARAARKDEKEVATAAEAARQETDPKVGTEIVKAARDGDASRVAELMATASFTLEGQTHGQTALQVAAMRGHAMVIETLIAAGCDVNARDHYSQTALHVVAAFNKLDAAEMLLAHGADVNVEDSVGDSPLRCAESNRHHAMVALLKEASTPEGIQRIKLSVRSQATEAEALAAAFVAEARLHE